MDFYIYFFGSVCSPLSSEWLSLTLLTGFKLKLAHPTRSLVAYHRFLPFLLTWYQELGDHDEMIALGWQREWQGSPHKGTFRSGPAVTTFAHGPLLGCLSCSYRLGAAARLLAIVVRETT